MRHEVIIKRFKKYTFKVEFEDSGIPLEAQVTGAILALVNADDVTTDDIESIITYHGKNNSHSS